MSHFKALYQDCSREYLLERRALGDELSSEAHLAIEEIFLERQENLPPRPKTPVLSKDIATAPSKSLANIKTALLILLCLLVSGFAKELAGTWLGLTLLALTLGTLVVLRLTSKEPTPEQKEEETLGQIADRDKLNPLMLAAASGNLLRAQELVAFGQDLNVQSLAGATALMYAARNGHAEVVAFLLENGASPDLGSPRGVTALSLAKKFGHAEVEALLLQQGASA